MYENVELSDEVTVGVKKNNEKLLKNITRVGDIGTLCFIQIATWL